MAQVKITKTLKNYNDLLELIENIISNLTGGYGSVTKDTDIKALMELISNYRDNYIKDNAKEVYQQLNDMLWENL